MKTPLQILFVLGLCHCASALGAASSDEAPRIYNEDVVDLPPRAINSPAPVGPALLRQGVEAKMLVGFVVTEKGEVTDLSVLRATITLAATGQPLDQASAATLAKSGALGSVPEGATLEQILKLIEKSFADAAFESIRKRTYQAGARAGKLVSIRTTALVSFAYGTRGLPASPGR